MLRILFVALAVLAGAANAQSPVSLGSVLKEKFPNAQRGPVVWDWEVRDDGDGPRIVYWNAGKLGPQPSEANLRKWVAEYKPPKAATAEERLARSLAREGLTIQDMKAILAK